NRLSIHEVSAPQLQLPDVPRQWFRYIHIDPHCSFHLFASERTTPMLHRPLSAIAFALALAVPLSADEKPNPAATPAQKDPKRHEGFLKDIMSKQGKIDVVFLGDSITDGWRGQGKIWNEHFGKFNPLNLGIGGDRTQHVLWRIQNGELEGYKPKAFVI